MLHYFAKKFFHATILSAYIEHDNISLYYINDNVVQHSGEFHDQQTHDGDFDSRQYRGTEIRRFGSRLNEVFTSVLESPLNRFMYAGEDWLNHSNNASLTDSDDDDDSEGIDEMTVNVKHADNSLDEFHLEPENCIVRLHCFRWNSFNPTAVWNVTFRQVCMLNVGMLLLWCSAER